MIKKIQKYGGSLIIRFDPEEIEWYGLKLGDRIDLSDIVIVERNIKKGGKKNDNRKTDKRD